MSTFMDEPKCEAGTKIDPSAWCTWHGYHYWCATCQGFYGVPHVGIHEGPNKHPNYRDSATCACRVCKIFSGREVNGGG